MNKDIELIKKQAQDERNKKFYAINREQILKEAAANKVVCEFCGDTVRQIHLIKHQSTRLCKRKQQRNVENEKRRHGEVKKVVIEAKKEYEKTKCDLCGNMVGQIYLDKHKTTSLCIRRQTRNTENEIRRNNLSLKFEYIDPEDDDVNV
jgi:formylmethanofuran dehydrogenase subunit E